MLNCKRCAVVWEKSPKTGKEEYRIINNPTIGDIRRLRNKGAIILHQTVVKYGNEIHKMWRSDEGVPVVHSVEYK